MKKDGRFWILIGALVIVGGLFVAFMWSVMAAPSEPTGNQVVANVTEPAPTANASGEKPPGEAPGLEADNIMREAQSRMEQATRDAENALREAREAADRAQLEAFGDAAGEKPTDGGKPQAY